MKNTTDTLKAGEERLRLIIEASPNAMLMVDDRGRITLVNQQVEKLFGYPRAELLGEIVERLVPGRFSGKHPDHRADFFHHPTARAMGAGRELFGRRKDGSEVPIEIGLNPIKTDEGSFVIASIIDITERKRVEQVARESEERLHTVLESLSEGLVISDLEGQVIHWNRAGLVMHGFSSMDECLVRLPDFQNIFELSSLEGKALDLEQWPLARVIAGEALVDYEVNVRRLDREWNRVFSYGGAIVQEPNGRPLAFVAITDITERKQAEEQLRLQSAAVRAAANAILITDRAGKILWVNPAFTQTTGYSFAEVEGKNPRVLKSGKQDQVFYRDMWETILAGNVWHNTVINRRKDGTLNREDLTITPIRDDAGTITHFVGIKQDITEKTRALEAMLASELRYRRLFESAKDGILILEGASGQIIDINPFLTEMLGYAKEDLMGKELWEIGIFKDIADSKAAFLELQRQGYIRYEDLPLETKKGGKKQVEFISNSYLVNGSSVIQCNIRDITERKLAERTLMETNEHLEDAVTELRTKSVELASMTQQLWQASKLATMGELSASIAHELNNPLATVALRTESLLMRLPEDSEQRKPLEIITQEVDRMAVLVNNLLQFSRRSHRQISTVDPREEIVNSIELVQYHLRSRKIDVEQEFVDPLPTIQADRQQLRQLFLNLLTNASDAMPEGGKLTVRAALDGSSATAVAVEFADKGEGITAANLERIWDPFFTTKPEGKGTGLGLAICRRIVEEHGGTIDIQSQPGQGTTVRMIFPATGKGIDLIQDG